MKYEKYVFVGGEKVYVSNEVYQALKKQKNREEYVSRLDREYLDTNFMSLIGVDNIEDRSVDVEKIAYMNMLLEKLREVMEDLSDEELYRVKKLYFDEEPTRTIAERINISHTALIKKKNKIIEKMRKLLGV